VSYRPEPHAIVLQLDGRYWDGQTRQQTHATLELRVRRDGAEVLGEGGIVDTDW
jgi:hypothetical protein